MMEWSEPKILLKFLRKTRRENLKLELSIHRPSNLSLESKDFRKPLLRELRGIESQNQMGLLEMEIKRKLKNSLA